jgi:hypothetical protein
MCYLLVIFDIVVDQNHAKELILLLYSIKYGYNVWTRYNASIYLDVNCRSRTPLLKVKRSLLRIKQLRLSWTQTKKSDSLVYVP